MKKLLVPLVLAAGLSLADARAVAGEPCGPECFAFPRSRWQRLCDRLRPECHSSSCGQGKTHLDMGCTGCRADCVFVFGNCCEFFEEPDMYRGPLDHLRWGRR